MTKKQKAEERTIKITRYAVIILSALAGWATDRVDHAPTPPAATGNITVVLHVDRTDVVTSSSAAAAH